MLFNEDGTPKGGTDACKRCMFKPCRRLLSGRIFPGKLLFVHRSSFVSIPCNPLFASNTAQVVQPETSTEDLEIVQGQIGITNPRWEHKDPDKLLKTPDNAVFGDILILMADVTNLPEGHAVTFDIYDSSQQPAQRIDSARGKNVNGIAKAEWKIVDKTGKLNEQTVEFEATAKSITTARTEIQLTVKEFVFSF